MAWRNHPRCYSHGRSCHGRTPSPGGLSRPGSVYSRLASRVRSWRLLGVVGSVAGHGWQAEAAALPESAVSAHRGGTSIAHRGSASAATTGTRGADGQLPEERVASPRASIPGRRTSPATLSARACLRTRVQAGGSQAGRIQGAWTRWPRDATSPGVKCREMVGASGHGASMVCREQDDRLKRGGPGRARDGVGRPGRVRASLADRPGQRPDLAMDPGRRDRR